MENNSNDIESNANQTLEAINEKEISKIEKKIRS